MPKRSLGSGDYTLMWRSKAMRWESSDSESESSDPLPDMTSHSAVEADYNPEDYYWDDQKIWVWWGGAWWLHDDETGWWKKYEELAEEEESEHAELIEDMSGMQL